MSGIPVRQTEYGVEFGQEDEGFTKTTVCSVAVMKMKTKSAIENNGIVEWISVGWKMLIKAIKKKEKHKENLKQLKMRIKME